MFPDTPNFSDPTYSDINVAPEIPLSPNDIPTEPDLGIGLPSGIPSNAPPLVSYPQGPGAPVSAQPGSSLLGWLGLGNQIAQTAIAASRGGQPTVKRPGTLTQSVAATGTMTLIMIVLLFVGAIFVLRKA
jgi:hypothetical protein